MTSPIASGSQSPPVNVQEFSIRVPKHVQKRYHVMRFNGTLDVDFGKWTKVSMERENNMKEYKGADEELPKFGAGSEFGREAKEEARRKKLGIVARKYKVEDQPWILKSMGSTVKKFKGIREGGVSNNTAYYVFTHAEDGAIEAFPLQEWYKFQPIQRYKALSAEEAEMEFSKRNKHLNYFSLMLRKRLKGEEEADLDEGEEKSKKSTSKKEKDLKISEMDEWMDSSDEDSSVEEEKEDPDENDKKKKGKKAVPKKKKRDTDAEAFEDSDDGDGEGRELDYISDSSDSEPENVNLDGVAEEKALRKLLNSDEESDEDSEKSEKEQSNEDDDKEKETEKKEETDEKDKKKKKKKTKKDVKKDLKKDAKIDDNDFSSDSSSDEETKKNKKEEVKKVKKEEKEVSSENSSRSATPTDNKRKLINDVLAGPSPKKVKLDLPTFIAGSNESGITEDAVRKYLMRKPMTTTELLQKFKSKKTGLSSEQLVNIMTQILKKINPVKQTLKGKMYLSIKS
ncbi:general transcription factor IIF subunit 1 [Diorhabda carinulata]|uniref:general transcription factor IIF subunit 1 n=1 Tax=Diorhabda carinulata TaxID=1163345 RepID=UPI0025A246F4|nr:general transcription factor IIF subunit 1 [Diorhabda carinulata]